MSRQHPIDATRKALSVTLVLPVFLPALALAGAGYSLYRLGELVGHVALSAAEGIAGRLSSTGYGDWGVGFLTDYKVVGIPAIVMIAKWDRLTDGGHGYGIGAGWRHETVDITDPYVTKWSNAWGAKLSPPSWYRLRRVTTWYGPFVTFKVWREYESTQQNQ